MYFQFSVALALTILAMGVSALMIGLQKLLAPNNPYARKLMPYECGEPPTGRAWINFNVRFYLIALIFVIFEVEVAFVYPIAAVYLGLGAPWSAALRAQRNADFPAHPVRRAGLRVGQARPRMDKEGARKSTDA